MISFKHSFILIVFSLLALSACRTDEASIKKGQEFGKTHTNSQCANQAFQYHVECSHIDCGVVPADFAKGCVMTAKVDQAYCKSIPVQSALESVKWLKKECSDHKNPDLCQSILKHAVGRCIATRPPEASKEKAATQQSVKEKQ